MKTEEQIDKVRPDAIQRKVANILNEARRNPAILTDPRLRKKLQELVSRIAPESPGLAEVLYKYLLITNEWSERMTEDAAMCAKLKEQNAELVGVIRKQAQTKPEIFLAVGVTRLESKRLCRDCIYVHALAPHGETVQVFELTDISDINGNVIPAIKVEDLPELPFYFQGDAASRVFLELWEHAHPCVAEYHEVKSILPSSNGGAWELEYKMAGQGDTTRTAKVRPALGRVIQEKLEGDDRIVTVRREGPVVTALQEVHEEEKINEPFVEYLPEDSRGLEEFHYPEDVGESLHTIANMIASGESTELLLVGPQGVGKTIAMKAILATAARVRRGPWKVAIVSLDMDVIGSSYIHETSNTIGRVFEVARKLKEKGYVMAVVGDEIDGIFGGAAGHSKAYTEEEDTIKRRMSESRGYPVFGTMNVRSETIPGPIRNRFEEILTVPKAGRSIILNVAQGVVARPGHQDMLEKLALPGPVVAGALTDMLFSDDFMLAEIHLHSGAVIPVRLRDTYELSPRKVEKLLNGLRKRVNYGRGYGNWDACMRWVRGALSFPELQESNLKEQTTIEIPTHDSVKRVRLIDHGNSGS